MKKILFLFLAACFFFSCEKETIVIPQQHAGRTVLAFFWADNSLNSSLRNNIQTMMQGLQAMKDSAALLVYWDGEASDISWPEPCIVEYVTNGQGGINSLSKGTTDAMMADKNTSIYDLIGIGNIRKKYPPQTSTEKTVMQTVIGDMMSAYPSESYGIIFGSHGSGWLPTITGTRSIGQDGGRYSSDTALIPELAEVLRTVNPQKFDFVLFDACMMGCAEVYYELKDAARYCIASVLDIPAAGFPYASVMPYLYEKGEFLHTLILSPPRSGKTTLLRDMIRQISDGTGFNGGLTVGVVDERSEIGACYQGEPQNELGIRTDILDCCPKALGMMMMIRTMSPQVIAVDEIGSREDLAAMEYVMNCGCKLIATVHGNSIDDIRQKPVLRRLVQERWFERYVLLSGRGKPGNVEEIYDARGTRLYPSGRSIYGS